MAKQGTGSLDRFVRTRGAAMLDRSPTAIRWWRGAALANAVVGLGLGLAPFLTEPSGLHWVLLVPPATLLALSGGMLGMAARLSKAGRGVAPGLRMSREAEALLSTLWEHTESGWGPGPRSCREALSPEAHRLLEAAAFQYNRLFGLMSVELPARSATLERHAPEIRAAADEAMAEVLHAAARMERYPENAACHEERAGPWIAALHELSGQVEQLLLHAPAAAGASQSRIECVLERLRVEVAAREELSQQPARPAEQPIRLRGGSGTGS